MFCKRTIHGVLVFLNWGRNPQKLDCLTIDPDPILDLLVGRLEKIQQYSPNGGEKW